MKNLTEKQILKLKPEFSLNGGMRAIDWFNVTKGEEYYCISSGLRHADGVTKSPYYYDECFIEKGCKKISIEKFNTWWNGLREKVLLG